MTFKFQRIGLKNKEKHSVNYLAKLTNEYIEHIYDFGDISWKPKHSDCLGSVWLDGLCCKNLKIFK